MMITAAKYDRIAVMIKEAKNEIAENEKVHFGFNGFDEEFIYFTLCCRLSEIQESEIDFLKHKTRFIFVSENTKAIFKAECKMRII